MKLKKHKMIAKGCPKCDQQVPVACKACPCGYSFFNAKRTTQLSSLGNEETTRRTRVRREKPNYYDSLEYDKQLKKNRARISECDNDGESSTSTRKKRKLKKEDEEEDDVINHLSVEKQHQCSIILAELNRKMGSVTWKPS